MKTGFVILALSVGLLVGCSTTSKAPNVADNIKNALNQQPGLKDVSVKQDRDKGVVTLGGHVLADPDKSEAENIARSLAAGQVVANEIAVLPPYDQSDAKRVDSDLDRGIEKNLDAALLQNRMHDYVKYSVKNGVVTLTGSVDSVVKRGAAAKIASGVPNVQQVVNELDVKNVKATSN